MSRRWTVVGLIPCVVMVAAGCRAEQPAATEPTHQIFDRVPAKIETSARYLLYLHGAIIERAGIRPTHPQFGVYEYRKILETLAGRGFVVVSEARPEGTDGRLYAAAVASQVRELLAAGVPPENITVVGFSKGGGIAIAASSMLANDHLNFVFVAACGQWLEEQPEIVPHGRVLALREASDGLAGSCATLFARFLDGSTGEEITLELGGGHGAFYRPRPEWIDPIVEWAGQPTLRGE